MKRRWLAFPLIIAGLSLIVKAGWEGFEYHQFQSRSLSKQMPEVSSTFPASDASSRHLSLIGEVRVPRLQLRVPVLEGDDEEVLRLGAGHITGTAFMGQTGNAVIAGHRDTVFWPLQHIAVGDVISIHTKQKYTYSVTRTKVVTPDDISVLQESNTATLTLVTCYPFRHVGPSPKRFIVIAKLINPSK